MAWTKKANVSGSAFLAGAFFLGKTHDINKKTICSIQRSWQCLSLGKTCPDNKRFVWLSVPRKGFCLSWKYEADNEARVSGSAFLAKLFSGKYMT